MGQENIKKKALKAAFPHTIPILTGFGFLGLAFGISMSTSGFHPLYSTLMSIVIFGGSIQFVAVPMLLAPFAPLEALFMALLINARHLFYGISMLEKYNIPSIKKYYLIFGMCDETFSINCTATPPADVDRGWFYFFVTLLDHSYWVMGSTIGAIFGAIITFNTTGIEFVMTALFVVIFVEQLLTEKNHVSSIIGVALPLVCLVVTLALGFESRNFLIPSMIAIMAALTIGRRPIEKGEVAR